jgi:hypothetical protein
MAKAATKKKSASKNKPAPKQVVAKKAVAKKAVAKKAVAKKAAPKKTAPKKAAAKTKPTPKKVAVAAGSGELLGEITVPSGTLAVFDIGLLGFLPREAMEPAIIKTPAPTDHPLAVIGHRVGKGRYADCWDHVIVKLAAGEVTHSTKLGEAGVDMARLVCMDYGALDAWQHEDSLDGKADVVFSGRDEKAAARSTGAKPTGEGYGWSNLSLADADAKQLEVDKLKAAAHWALAIDFRPHSHHYYAVAEARKNKLGAGTIEVGGAQVLLFFTTWGDGVFPVFLDLDATDQPVQLRIVLADQSVTSAS